MASRIILICFRVFIGLITFLLASILADIFKSVRIMTSSSAATTQIVGGIAFLIVTYLLGFIVEMTIDKISGLKISKEIKEI